MLGFDLPKNFHEDLEAIFRRVRSHVIPPQQNLSITNPTFLQSLSPRNVAMANKTIYEFTSPSAANAEMT